MYESARTPAVVLAALLGMTGCLFDPSGVESGDPVDAAVALDDSGNPIDADPNAPDASQNNPDATQMTPDAAQMPPDAGMPCLDWQPPTHFDPCDIAAPDPGLTLDISGDYVYNTTNGVLTAPGGGMSTPASTVLMPPDANPAVRVLSVDFLDLRAAARLRVIGDHPLVIAGWDTIDVAGTIDVSSTLAGEPGAGALNNNCNAAGEGEDQTGGGGGGGGGGGAGMGDDGGDGGDGDDGNAAKGAKGAKLGNAPANVRGGCPGGRGGSGDRVDGSGVGGEGGGALQLTAQNSITVSGVLHAGGSGGDGADGNGNADRRSGGGGGGSGGFLGLEAPNITLQNNAILAANGGGGGGGCDNNAADPGQDGQPGAVEAAFGDHEGGGSGNGGAGAWRDRLTGGTAEGGDSDRGGGGGGGGVGFILTKGLVTNNGATLSPARQNAP